MRETQVDADLTPGPDGLGRAAGQRSGSKDAALGARPVDAATMEPPTAGTDGNTRRPRDIAPRWFEMMTLSCIVILATVGSSGLLLAVIGAYTTVAALAIGLPLAVIGVLILHRGLPPGATSRAAHVGAGIAVAIAIGYAIFAGITPSQHVVVSRDPGSYMTTAVQLTKQGALEIDARGQAFEGIRGLKFSGAAVYDTGRPYPARSVPGEPGEVRESGIIEPQFNHLASVALAVGLDVGGYRLMFRLPALIAALGLLALYSVTVRATGRPLLSLLAPALLAVSMPLLFVARNTYRSRSPWRCSGVRFWCCWGSTTNRGRPLPQSVECCWARSCAPGSMRRCTSACFSRWPRYPSPLPGRERFGSLASGRGCRRWWRPPLSPRSVGGISTSAQAFMSNICPRSCDFWSRR